MQIKLSSPELVAALQDWLVKQMPELMAADPRLTLGEITPYPPSVTVTVNFVLPQVEPIAEKPS